MEHRPNVGPGMRTTMLKVVILGDGGVGKSCLMNRFVSNQFDEHSFHTIGVEFLNKDIVVDGESYTLQIWDTAGQERFRTLRTPFYRGSDICMLTYSIDDRISFANLNMWQKEFLQYADVKEDAQFPFIVIGNKSDMASIDRQVSQLEMETWCNDNNIASCLEASAKNASNVQEAFQIAVKYWAKVESRHDRDRASLDDTVDLTEKYGTSKSCCG